MTVGVQKHGRFFKGRKQNKQMPIVRSEIKGRNSCLTNIYNVYIMDNGNIQYNNPPKVITTLTSLLFSIKHLAFKGMVGNVTKNVWLIAQITCLLCHLLA